MQATQTRSIGKNPLRRSVVSKASCYSSILNTPSPDQNLQILRISLKKEIDRKEKLERLMEKYEQINVQQKSHIKAIKANIIELKDLESSSKTRFYLNPVIYVDNRLSKDTREYLCMLLNTFYAKYDQNNECEFKTKQLSKDMNQLLESISKNQENLLKIEKETIGVQVQLEGELLSLKTKLKEENQRQKQLEDENKRVGAICSEHQQQYELQLSKVQKLRANSEQLEQKISKLQEKVADGELVKKGKQQMMANEMAYHEKFKIQLSHCDDDIKRQIDKQNSLKIKIKQKKLKVQQLRGRFNKICRAGPPSALKNQLLNQSTVNTSNPSPQMRMSLTHIKKYECLVDSINSTLQMNKSYLGQDIKSKECVDHEVGLRMVELKTQHSLIRRKNQVS